MITAALLLLDPEERGACCRSASCASSMDSPLAVRRGQLIMQTDASTSSQPQDARPPGLTSPHPAGDGRLTDPVHAIDARPSDRGPAYGDATHSVAIGHLCPYARQIYLDSSLEHMPTEILLHILSFLDVNDLLSASRVCVLHPPPLL